MERVIFITCGNSANLENVNIRNYNEFVFVTKGMNIFYDRKVKKLPVDILDTQNYIAASEIVIAKAGWGTIAESLIAGSKLVLIERSEVYEDTYMINFLKNENLAISIEEDELQSLDIKTLFKRANKSIDIDRIYNSKNDTRAILNLLSL